MTKLTMQNLLSWIERSVIFRERIRDLSYGGSLMTAVNGTDTLHVNKVFSTSISNFQYMDYSAVMVSKNQTILLARMLPEGCVGIFNEQQLLTIHDAMCDEYVHQQTPMDIWPSLPNENDWGTAY